MPGGTYELDLRGQDLPGKDAGWDVRAGPYQARMPGGTYELDLRGQDLPGEDAGWDVRAGLVLAGRAGTTRRGCRAGHTSWTWAGRTYQAKMLGGTYELDLGGQELPGEDAGWDIPDGLARAGPTRRGCRPGRTSWTCAGRTYQARISGGTYELDLGRQNLPDENVGWDVRAGLARAGPTQRGSRAGRTSWTCAGRTYQARMPGGPYEEEDYPYVFSFSW